MFPDDCAPLSAMELATKKRDRENKENKEKILSNTRREIERKNEYQVLFSCISVRAYSYRQVNFPDSRRNELRSNFKYVVFVSAC